jgi:hypothetical protein
MEEIGLGLRLLRSPSRDRECKAEGWLRIRGFETTGSRCHKDKRCHTDGSRASGRCVRDEYAVRYGTWRKTKSKRHAERDPGFGHHDEFLLKSAVIPETFRQEAVA